MRLLHGRIESLLIFFGSDLVLGGRKSDAIDLRSILGTIDELYTPAGHQQVRRRREMVGRIMSRICARFDSAKFRSFLSTSLGNGAEHIVLSDYPVDRRMPLLAWRGCRGCCPWQRAYKHGLVIS
ncbi:hypothetical protein DL95DRAFT_153952 [Leptodontidium sp. 2 PMI_412]|nr:hypothetical protein DL95DRAFT_153952 [Leptodontidium sp. 2 PMI_412]